MSATEQTAVAKIGLPPEIELARQQAKARNAMAAAIRGQQWGKDLSPDQTRAVAHYCHENGLDPVRHVEILGGRIYLTAEYYREKSAPLVLAGVVQPEEPDLISADPRLDELAAEGDAWAKEERARRLRARIQHGVPDEATAAFVCRIRITATGRVVTGVNWCGAGLRMKKARDGSQYEGDPIGAAEPTKTAESRAWRRAWRNLVEVGASVTSAREVFARIEQVQGGAEALSSGALKELPAAVSEPAVAHPPPILDDAYGDGDGAMPHVQHAVIEEDPFDDR